MLQLYPDSFDPKSADQSQTDYLLSMGPSICHGMAEFKLEFKSAADGSHHSLQRVVHAPSDSKKHTYRLEFLGDHYKILIDG